MATLHPCPHLGAEVELTAERRQHVVRKHPDLLPRFSGRISETLADPDCVIRRRDLLAALLFLRWYDSPGTGKYVAVVVVSDPGEPVRHWIVTAYMRRRLPRGVIEWQRS